MTKTNAKNYTEEIIGKNSSSGEYNPFNKTSNNGTNITNTSGNASITKAIAKAETS